MSIFITGFLIGAAFGLGAALIESIINSLKAYFRKPEIDGTQIIVDRAFCKWVSVRHPVIDYGYKKGDRTQTAIWILMAEAWAYGKREGKDGN